ncbi:MAG: formyltetrahydrofolate deformylase [Phycisphaeraceae bacterium]|nr:formyltetrahydrofolate deformylase [Phycisphaeraceae bacterium]
MPSNDQPPPATPKRFRLIASCPDRIGIVARVAGYFAENGASIVQANQYEDLDTKTFFMRYVVDAGHYPGDVDAFAEGFKPIATDLAMKWRLVDVRQRQRVVVLVSRFDHCLAYLLHRWKVGDLRCDIPCVVSNHPTLGDLVRGYDIPFHHIPIPTDPAGKRAGFARTTRMIEKAAPDTIVLARYMQIFPAWLCEKFRHRIINIHHSFLPSFAGANPYQQAAERGVKLIGATCHYVTEQLDAGPIIEQDVVRIRHSDSIHEMKRNGKDVENTVLARGLRYHLEDRVLVQGNKTILFT